MRAVHIITPGDHFSPSTGSAVPTVVDGLSRFAPAGTPAAAVVVGAGTNPDRYDSARIIEYEAAAALSTLGTDGQRRLDALLGLMGLPRVGARRAWSAALADQSRWSPSAIVGHNALQLMPVIERRRHRGVLYFHNRLLRSYHAWEADRVLGDTAALIFVSSWLAAQEAERLPKRLRDRMHVVRNGVDVEAFQRSGPLERGEFLTVMFLGRMIPEKGADVLVEAIARLRRADIRLVLVGSAGFDASAPPDDYERRVRRAARALPGPVEILPFVPRPEVARLLQRADVTVVPSRWPDPCPLTVLEGMAAGAAVVASRTGGIPEEMGDSGLLVAPDDPDELAQVLAALADDESYRAREAHRGLAHARAHDWTYASAGFHEVLRRISG